LKSLTNPIDVDKELREIKITMHRNAIANETEQIQNALQLSTMLSQETVVGLLQDFVPSIEVELERLAEEKERSISFMQDNFNDHEPVVDDREENAEVVGE
ncbi:phage portal protein, partial [Turicibacter sanguinis]|nr:phage portal protein [Turicibacter sanguinis]